MKLGPFSIGMAKKPQPKKETKKPKSNVYQFPVMTQQQGFSSYKNIKGSQMLSYDLIDGLYSNTIMNRVIQKLAGDTTRMNYSVTCTDFEGNRIEEIEMLVKQIDIKLTRKVLRSVVIDFLKYGSSFLYIQYDKGTGLPLQAYTIHPKFLSPVIENGQLVKWKYRSQGTEVELSPEELVFFAYDPQTGELFGNSIFGPIIQILELILNSQLNTAIIIDRFAIPVIQWLIDSKEEGVITDPNDLLTFLEGLVAQLNVGNDIATDSGVSADVIGIDGNIIDFVPIIRNLMETFGITVGIPLQILGMSGDNLSVSTRQYQTYLEHVRDLQGILSDVLVEKVYRPFLEAQGKIQGIDYYSLFLSFPVTSVEEGSKSATWIFPSVNSGLISREEARNALGYVGPAVPIEEIEIPQVTPEVVRPGARKNPEDEPETEKPQEADGPDRKHDKKKSPEEK